MRLDDLAAATPPGRDRVVDAARALCIVVVVLWHWVLSVTHRAADGSLVMPNPIDAVPLAWAATWLLQVMPLFFVVGGYAHLAAWQARRDNGTGAAGFVLDRLRRLCLPTAAWAAVWFTGEFAAALVTDTHRFMWQWFPGYLTPLWFVGVYAGVIVLVPLTAAAHEWRAGPVLAGMAVLIGAGTALHRGAGLAWAGWFTAAVVWIFCHQLGYAWRSWRLGRRPVRVRAAITAAGLVALIGLTTLAGLPRSMVATSGSAESNLLPTSAAIAALAVFQLGVIAWGAPAADRLLHLPSWWRTVVAVNAVAMTVFVWHMTAYLVVLLGYEATGATLLPEPTSDWWAQRWLWLLAPLLPMAALVAVFGPVEAAARRPRRR